MGRDVRWTDAASDTNLAIPDGGGATRSVSPHLPPGFSPLSIMTAYEIDHPDRSTVGVVLEPPVGSNITLLSVGGETGAGVHYEYQAAPTSAAGGGAWNFTASDSDGIDTLVGELSFAAVTIVCAGGVAPFPGTARYESALRELGDVVGFAAVTWQLRQGTTAAVKLRTCDDAEACASEPWTEVGNGEVPAVMPRRFAQYAVDLTTDGDTPTALDWGEVSYSTRPE